MAGTMASGKKTRAALVTPAITALMANSLRVFITSARLVAAMVRVPKAKPS